MAIEEGVKALLYFEVRSVLVGFGEVGSSEVV